MTDNLTSGDRKLLKSWVGSYVNVAITEDGFSRNHYGPQIAIGGILERHSNSDDYRVVVNEHCFAYFTPAQIVLVNPLTSTPTIMLSIPVDDTELAMAKRMGKFGPKPSKKPKVQPKKKSKVKR